MARRKTGGETVLGIDIGGSGIKGAPVDLARGKLLTEPFAVGTPTARTPKAMIEAVARVVRHFDWQGPIGCGFPGVVQRGVVRTASHIDDGWLGVDVGHRLNRRLARPVPVINDADAAGLAEMRFGAGRGRNGLVLMLTLGTGIGTALFFEGRLVPNLELGQIRIKKRMGHEIASNQARKELDLSWKKWAKNLDAFLERIRLMLWPDLVIIGGGVSAKADRFVPRLTVDMEVVPAVRLNAAGIIGAALAGGGHEDAEPALG